MAHHFVGQRGALRQALGGAVLHAAGRRRRYRLEAGVHQLLAGDHRDHARLLELLLF
jgi:hypothetical protein